MLWAWNVDIFVRLDLRGWAPPATHYHFNHILGTHKARDLAWDRPLCMQTDVCAPRYVVGCRRCLTKLTVWPTFQMLPPHAAFHWSLTCPLCSSAIVSGLSNQWNTCCVERYADAWNLYIHLCFCLPQTLCHHYQLNEFDTRHTRLTAPLFRDYSGQLVPER